MSVYSPNNPASSDNPTGIFTTNTILYIIYIYDNTDNPLLLQAQQQRHHELDADTSHVLTSPHSAYLSSSPRVHPGVGETIMNIYKGSGKRFSKEDPRAYSPKDMSFVSLLDLEAGAEERLTKTFHELVLQNQPNRNPDNPNNDLLNSFAGSNHNKNQKINILEIDFTATKSGFQPAVFKWDREWNKISGLKIDEAGLKVLNAGSMAPIRANTSFSSGMHTWKIHCEKAVYMKIGIVNAKASKTSQLAADVNGWAVYNNGQLRHSSNGSGSDFSSKYTNGTTVRVELDLQSTPHTLSFTIASDKQGKMSVKKAFDIPKGEYWPAVAVQGSSSVYLVDPVATPAPSSTEEKSAQLDMKTGGSSSALSSLLGADREPVGLFKGMSVTPFKVGQQDILRISLKLPEQFARAWPDTLFQNLLNSKGLEYSLNNMLEEQVGLSYTKIPQTSQDLQQIPTSASGFLLQLFEYVTKTHILSLEKSHIESVLAQE